MLEVAEIGRRFDRGVLTPSACLDHFLARIAVRDPALNSILHLDLDGAKAAAAQADRDLRAGRRRGPLHGIPVAIKDIIDVAGLPTTCHSRLLLGNVAATDAEVVRRLRASGAIIIAKTATHEFAVGGPAFDLPFPPARNPWNRAHHPGGSSSGSGAGVAAGLFPLALGTDTGGSVRHPASASGIVGLKATYGVVSRRGVFPLSFTMDHVGTLARRVADAAVLLDVIASYDPASPGSIDRPPDAADGIEGGLRGVRIGYVRHFHETDIPATAEVSAALDNAVAMLERAGAIVRDVHLPPLGRFAAVNRVILESEAFAVHAAWMRERPLDYCALSRRALLAGAFFTAEDFVQAQRLRARLIAAVEAVFREVDILVTASSMETPCRIDDADDVARSYSRQARTPFSVTGHPALAMMSGLSSTGLPLSVQFAGRYFQERTVCRVAAAFERDMNYPVWPAGTP